MDSINEPSFRFLHKVPQVTMLVSSDYAPTALVVSKIVAAALCTRDQKPCGKCAGCLRAEGASATDVAYYDARNGLPKEQVVNLKELLASTGAKCEHPLFFVLDGVEHLNSFAANTLLKFLEEPPAGTYFVLVARNLARVLPTVISRATLYRVPADREAFEKDVRALTKDANWQRLLLDACTDGVHARLVLAGETRTDLMAAVALMDSYRRQTAARAAFTDFCKSLDYPTLGLLRQCLLTRYADSPTARRVASIDLDRRPLRVLVADRMADALRY